MLEFAHPWILLLLVVVPLTVWWYSHWGHRTEGTVQFSSIKPLLTVSRLSGEWKVRLLMVLRLVIITLLIMAMARPRTVVDLSDSSVDVVDMVLVLDISSSMRAEDFKPNRLGAAKQTAKKFIEDREGDRIGLLVFAGETYIQCPLTVDYDVLHGLLSQSRSLTRRTMAQLSAWR